ncbi:hypothetical protein ACFQU1_20325 [Chelatococcus sp. GCM10030263]|uniref:hypothetical protein n=1 Tax=Chelatococcus sp. GCM10030263 TaxID=3273387 RepID=UPI003620361A
MLQISADEFVDFNTITTVAEAEDLRVQLETSIITIETQLEYENLYHERGEDWRIRATCALKHRIHARLRIYRRIKQLIREEKTARLRLPERIADLEAALRPFVPAHLAPHLENEARITLDTTMGDIRRAHAVLNCGGGA